MPSVLRFDLSRRKGLTGRMKRLLFTLLAALTACGQTGTGTGSRATIFGYLAEVETSYRITLESKNLKVLRQGITQRAVRGPQYSESRSRDGSVTTSSGLSGYRAYFLEFLYEDATIVAEQSVIDFYSGPDVLFSTTVADRAYRMAVTTDTRREIKAFAISLEGIPLVILDEVDRLEIRKPDRRATRNETFVR